VRSLQAHIAELRQQLAKISGGAGTSNPEGDADMPFPSLRQLPILGVTYADLYRRAKIQEAVYQFLTQQYEAAKVQEAKEIPTIKVLDAADVPERKWGPYRALMAILGGIVGFLVASLWSIVSARWRKRKAEDPYRLLFEEISASVRQNRIWKKGESTLRSITALAQNRRNGKNRPDIL
jgi:capsule polysaccharide export protein KpsE/RkpR